MAWRHRGVSGGRTGVEVPVLGYEPEFNDRNPKWCVGPLRTRVFARAVESCPVGSVAQNLGGQGNETVSVAIAPPPCPRCAVRRVDEYTHYGCPESAGEPHQHWLCAECDMEFVTPTSDVPSEPPQVTSEGKRQRISGNA
jgi:hypothetical protein